MKYKLFVSDFDGTLGVNDHIEPEVVQAIKEYTEKGGIFVIVTGRMHSMIVPICHKYGLKGLIVSYQGSVIRDIESGEILVNGGIDYPLAMQITKELLVEDGVRIVADMDEIMYCENLSLYTKYHKDFAEIKIVDDLCAEIQKIGHVVSKVVAAGDPEIIQKLTQKYSKKYAGKLICNGGADVLMEVVSPKYSKGNAVKFLSSYYGIPFDQIIAVGDSTNDIELVNGTWHGVAVGNAKEELKQVADEITVPFKENPVKVLLEKYCL
ncbi:MAG: HAD family hydrolase [Clostridia bacterium]|nr:HAD family hydrolase [Clostridia bacterium]